MKKSNKTPSFKEILLDTVISRSKKIMTIKKDVSYLTVGFLGLTTAITELSRGVIQAINKNTELAARVEELEKTNSVLVKLLVKDSKSSGMDVSLPPIQKVVDDDDPGNKPN